MRAILVAVDYADYLAITLPYNRHHFEEVMVVTSLSDGAVNRLAQSHGCRVFPTNSFYADGADFNKWKALEEGLDAFGRYGWLCIMDADVLWPKDIGVMNLQIGNLYTPFRRMMPKVSLPIPTEAQWGQYPKHRQEREFAGYTQIFHATDPHLPAPPWHQTDWRHAGGADSFFQARWPEQCKIRPAWNVLHLGPSGCNWCGRATPYVDGTEPPKAAELMNRLRAYIRGRRRGVPDPFAGERVKTSDCHPPAP